MSELEFDFKGSVDMNAIAKQIGESLGLAIGSDPQNVKCKGIRLFFVDDTKEVLMSSGLFVKGFSPEDWDDKNTD
jgi:hypothetical protein